MLIRQLFVVIFVNFILIWSLKVDSDEEKEEFQARIGQFCRAQTFDHQAGVMPKQQSAAGVYFTAKQISSAPACSFECCVRLINSYDSNGTNCDVAFFVDGRCLHIDCYTADGCSPVPAEKGSPQGIFVSVSQVKQLWEAFNVTNSTISIETARSSRPITRAAVVVPTPPSIDHSDPDSEESANNTSLIKAALDGEDLSCNSTEDCPVGLECLPLPMATQQIGPPGPPAFTDVPNGLQCRQQQPVVVSTTAPSTAAKTSSSSTTHIASTSTTTSAPKPNPKPKVMIEPMQSSYPTKTTVVLSGKDSTDPDGNERKFNWTQLDGPALASDSYQAKIWKLDNLQPGNYTFGLTVTDGKGQSASASVSFTIYEEPDSPPAARAGQCGSKEAGDFVVQLPADKVYICGNYSSDDKGVVSYAWNVEEKPANGADPYMENTDGLMLILKKLQAGHYQFRLAVKDAKGQLNSCLVGVNVLPESTKPPIANAGVNATVTLPKNSAILDGGGSSDNGEIKDGFWAQVEGPGEAEILNRDQIKATASKLVKGVYEFQLNITDTKGLSDVSSVWITVVEGLNTKPVVVCQDQTVSAAQKFVTVDGSKSHDDAGIVGYSWTPLDVNPASMEILNKSNEKSMLLLTNLVPGVYRFNLTVTDAQGSSAFQLVNLTVNPVDNEKDLIEAYLGIRLEELTQKQLKQFRSQLESFLSGMMGGKDDNVAITFTRVSEDFSTGRTYVQFVAEVVSSLGHKSHQSLTGLQAVELIKNSFPGKSFLPFSIDSIDTKICQNPCSGRGYCNNHSKVCTCDKYWMPNHFKLWFGMESNCDFSIFYVLLVVVILVSACSVSLWLATKMDRRRLRQGLLKKKKFAVAGHNRRGKAGSSIIKAKNGKMNSLAEPLLVSDVSSDLSSMDEDTIFERVPTKSDQSGHADA